MAPKSEQRMQHPFTPLHPHRPAPQHNASTTTDHYTLPWRWLLQPVAKATRWQQINERKGGEINEGRGRAKARVNDKIGRGGEERDVKKEGVKEKKEEQKERGK